MRTNIILDDDLVKKAQELTGIKTKRGVVHEALNTLVRLRSQKKVSALRGRIRWDGDLNKLREGRFHDIG